MSRITYILFCLLLPVAAAAQLPKQYLGAPNTIVVARGNLYADSILRIPKQFPSGTREKDTASLIYNAADSSVYVFTGSQWIKVSSGGTGSVEWGDIIGTLSDQTDLQNALNLKLNISDTSSMLSPYINSAGFGLTKVGQLVSWDTSVASQNYWRVGGNLLGSAKNFGSRDSQDVVFMTNGEEKMRLHARGVFAIGGTPLTFIKRGLYVHSTDTAYLTGGINLNNSPAVYTGISQSSGVISFRSANSLITTFANTTNYWQTNRAVTATAGRFDFYYSHAKPAPASNSTAITTVYSGGFNYNAAADTATMPSRLTGSYMRSFWEDSTTWSIGGRRHIPPLYRAYESSIGDSRWHVIQGRSYFGVPNSVASLPYGVNIWKSLSIHKDSLPSQTSIGPHFLLLVDSTNNSVGKILPSNLGFTTTIAVAAQIHDSLGTNTTVLRLPLIAYAGEDNDPDSIGIAGINGFGTVGQSFRVNATEDGLEWYTPTGGIESINSQTGSAITIAGSNGLTVGTTTNTVTVTLGGTLTGTTDIAGASNTLRLGTSGSKLGTFVVHAATQISLLSEARINLNGSISYHVDAYSSDADHTIPSDVGYVELNTVSLTEDRTITLPASSSNGQVLVVVVRYASSGSHYVLSSPIEDNKTGTTVSTLEWGTTYILYGNTSVAWMIVGTY